MTRDALILFLKAPRPGAVKTRLVPPLDPAEAAALYRVLAEEEVRRTAPRPGEYERLFFYAPAEARDELDAWFPGETWIPQAGDDLGQRMASAFEETFRRGARRAAIVGTDVPWVSRETVLESLAALGDHDVAVGPAEDGGYYLLALERPRPQLFHEIAWSTPAVFTATMASAGRLGLAVRVLETLPDVDTVEDLRAHWGRLRPLLASRPELREALEATLGWPEGRATRAP